MIFQDSVLKAYLRNVYFLSGTPCGGKTTLSRALGRRHGIRLANTVGVIDSDYYGADNEGHILVMLVNGGDHAVTIGRGERFCQGILVPFGLAEEEDVAGVRSGGFGSTGA